VGGSGGGEIVPLEAQRSVERLRLTGRDLELLAFAAEHRLVLPEHVAALLHVSVDAARDRLRALSRAGLLVGARPFHRERTCYQVSAKGLAAIDSHLRPPRRPDLRSYEHALGLAWR